MDQIYMGGALTAGIMLNVPGLPAGPYHGVFNIRKWTKVFPERFQSARAAEVRF